MPAMNNILSKWVPVSERSRSLSLVYSGMYLGSVTGLAFSPLLIHKFGWPSVFYSFGALGAVWFTTWATKVFLSSSVVLYVYIQNSSSVTNIVLWLFYYLLIYCTIIFKAYSSPLEDPGISAAEKKLITSQSTVGEPVKAIPWKLILSKPPVWALIVSHFCHNWGTFILLTWMPTYYNQVILDTK
jgi:ACS family sodium-dependent inorganic phosphate cotransporter